MWTVLVIALGRGHMYTHSEISVVLLSCILLLQDNHTHTFLYDLGISGCAGAGSYQFDHVCPQIPKMCRELVQFDHVCTLIPKV